MKGLSRRSMITTSAAAMAGLMVSGISAAADVKPQTTRDMPMRRPNLALTREECFEVIKRVHHAVLGTADASGEPYAVPVSPFMADGRLFFHGMGAGTGRKATNMRQNPRVSLCFIGYAKTDEAGMDVDYVSVIVAGDVVEVKDKAEKMHLMKMLMARHAPTQDSKKAVADRELKIEAVTGVYEVKIRSISGKAKGAAYPAFFGRQRPQSKS